MWLNPRRILTGKEVRVSRLKGKDGRKSGVVRETWRDRERDEGREVMIVTKRAFSCWAALWCCASEMGSSCGSALLFWDVKSSLLFHKDKSEMQMRDEDRKAKLLAFYDVQQVLSGHITLSYLLQLGKHVKAGRQRVTHYTSHCCSHKHNRTYRSACLLNTALLRTGSHTTYKLLISIYIICKLWKFIAAQQFHLIFVSTHTHALGCFRNARDIKEKQKPGCRSRNLFAEVFDGLFKCQIYPYLTIVSKWTRHL